MADIKYTPYENNTLGAKAIIQIPATLEDLIAISNPADVHNVAVRQICYNSWNNKFRKALVEKLEPAGRRHAGPQLWQNSHQPQG